MIDDNPTAFEKISAGLDDALAYAGGDTSRGTVVHPTDRAQMDKIARGSGGAVKWLLDDTKVALNITDDEMNFFYPTTVVSTCQFGEKFTGLALLYTMAKLRGKEMKIVFASEGEDDIVVNTK